MRWIVERRLKALTDSVRRAREELSVLDEQIEQVSEEAEDARIRAMVAETPIAAHDNFHAQRSAETLIRARAGVAERLDAMRAEQDRLLDQLGSSS